MNPPLFSVLYTALLQTSIPTPIRDSPESELTSYVHSWEEGEELV